MSLLEIPIKDNPDFSFTTILDSVAYDMRLQWNGRDESWYIYVGKANQPFIFKTKITNGSDIISKYRAYDSVPKGILLVVDKEKTYGRLQRDSFSSGRFSMFYYTKDLVPILQELNFIR